MGEIRKVATQRTVAVFNSHPDTLDLLRTGLEEDGFRVVVVDVRELRTGQSDLAEIRARTPFHVAVFDIALPYQATWLLFLELRATHLADIPVVLTTTNERALRQLVDAAPEGIIEIWGKPYDLQRLRASVQAAAGIEDRRSEASDRRQRTASVVPDGDRRQALRRQQINGRRVVRKYRQPAPGERASDIN